MSVNMKWQYIITMVYNINTVSTITLFTYLFSKTKVIRRVLQILNITENTLVTMF